MTHLARSCPTEPYLRFEGLGRVFDVFVDPRPAFRGVQSLGQEQRLRGGDGDEAEAV
jgi:hypothetical protein